MKITPFTLIQNKPLIQHREQSSQKTHTNYQTNTILPYSYNAYLIGFEARVDKGLERFSEANDERMPQTVKKYLETIDNKNTLTPLQAQQQAFEILSITDTAEDIKSAFPEEKLFEELINPEQSKARRGIIKAHNDYAPLLAEEGKGILRNKENLTVYLVKKIFLENKTIEEINKDLELDLEPDFKQVFLYNNENAKFVHPATLSALGIKTPGREYLQSLRYTKEGYADIMGGKIKSGLEAFYDSLTDQERTMRAKKTVANCENWWASLSIRQKLELLADKEAELKMLEQYNQHRQQIKKTTQKTSQTATPKPETKPKTHIKVGSTIFAKDELFKKWATFNLQLFRENLTETEKAELNIIQTRNMSRRWHNMSAIERTEYLSKMKSGQKPLRFAMIDAWNNCTDIIKDLTLHLKQNQIYKPVDLLYSSQEFSILQSQIMTEFWEKHPEHAIKLGESIQTSHQKIKDAINNGHFEELKRGINKDKTKRIKEIESFKFNLSQKTTPDYMKEFRKAFTEQPLSYERFEHLPKSYIDDYFTVIEQGFSENEIRTWTKSLQGLPLNEEEVEIIKTIGKTTPPESIRVTRAIETTLANFLFEKTKNPKVYEFDHGTLKLAYLQFMRNEDDIALLINGSEPFHTQFIDRKKPDTKKLSEMYNSLKQPLSDKDAHKIVNNFFEVTDAESEKELQKYISEFGKTSELIFSEKSTYSPSIKNKLYDNFMLRMPESLFGKVASLLDLHSNPFEREAQIKRVNFLLNKRFDFIPRQMMDIFGEEVSRSLRREKYDISQVETRVGTKRISANENKGLLILPKQNFLIQNKLRMLAAEQVLAEALFDATENPKVFALPFEQLCDNIEVFGLVKKFPSDTRTFETHYTGETIELVANKRIDLRKAGQEYIECINDVIDNWLNTKVKTDGFGKMLNLVDTLSCGETDPKILANIVKRITLYGLNLK